MGARPRGRGVRGCELGALRKLTKKSSLKRQVHCRPPLGNVPYFCVMAFMIIVRAAYMARNRRVRSMPLSMLFGFDTSLIRISSAVSSRNQSPCGHAGGCKSVPRKNPNM